MTRRKNDQIGFCDCLSCENRGQVSKERGSDRLYYNCEGDCGCVRIRGQHFQNHIIDTFVPLNPGDDPRAVLGLPPLESANDDADIETDAQGTEPAKDEHQKESDKPEIGDNEPADDNEPVYRRAAGGGWFGDLND